MKTMRFYFLPVLVLVATAAFALVNSQEPEKKVVDKEREYQTQIGWDKLKYRMGDLCPTGKNVWVAQIEPGQAAKDPAIKKPLLKPDLKAVFESVPNDLKLNVWDSHNSDVEFNGHGSMVGQYMFGRYSIAPGLRKIDILEPSRDFIGKWLANFEKNMQLIPKISSHSYVSPNTNRDAVRRLDDFIVKKDHIAVVAASVFNGETPIAPVFGSSYNSITVGLSNGKIPSGFVQAADDGAGRVRPDIVVPVTLTSIATPIVAASAALLVETAGDDEIAKKPIVIKAILMAGAKKDFYCESLSNVWTHSVEQPLNEKVGAGQLDIDTSHKIMASGQAKNVGSTSGWVYDSITKDKKNHMIVIDIPDGNIGTSVSAILVWNRTFEEGKPVVPNLDLRFGMVDSKNNIATSKERSISKFDNLEHIWSKETLEPGTYGFAISNVSESDTDFAIAWNVTTKVSPNARRASAEVVSQIPWYQRKSFLALIGLLGIFIVFVYFFRGRLGLRF